MSPIIFLISLKASRGWANKVNTKTTKNTSYTTEWFVAPHHKTRINTKISRNCSRSQPAFSSCLLGVGTDPWTRSGAPPGMEGHPQGARQQAKSSGILGALQRGFTVPGRISRPPPGLHLGAGGSRGADNDRSHLHHVTKDSRMSPHLFPGPRVPNFPPGVNLPQAPQIAKAPRTLFPRGRAPGWCLPTLWGQRRYKPTNSWWGQL